MPYDTRRGQYSSLVLRDIGFALLVRSVVVLFRQRVVLGNGSPRFDSFDGAAALDS
jgi:hypothetical protein